jgi:hypothetical protein
LIFLTIRVVNRLATKRVSSFAADALTAHLDSLKSSSSNFVPIVPVQRLFGTPQFGKVLRVADDTRKTEDLIEPTAVTCIGAQGTSGSRTMMSRAEH